MQANHCLFGNKQTHRLWIEDDSMIDVSSLDPVETTELLAYCQLMAQAAKQLQWLEKQLESANTFEAHSYNMGRDGRDENTKGDSLDGEVHCEKK